MPLILVDQDHNAIVDPEDLGWLNQYRWRYFATKGLEYALATVNGKTTYMHRLIMGLKPGDKRKVDHVDRNGLNNQRSNLRIGTHAQNLQNRTSQKSFYGKPPTSQYRGVFWSKKDGFWIAKAKLNDVMHVLGYYADEDQAGRVAAEWRRQNMPFSADAEQPPDFEAQLWFQEAQLRSAYKTGKANRGCSIEDCDSKHYCKGYCNKHYIQWRKGTL